MIKEMHITAERLSCKREDKLIFTNLSFKLQNGELLVVEGANGAGKSSLLRLLVGFSYPFSGEIYFNGTDIRQNLKTYQDDLHFIAHSNGIKLGLTVKENLLLTKHLNNIEPALSVLEITKNLGLIEQLDIPALFLSAGQKRKLSLAKLFYLPKWIWILDEPLTALDATMQQFFHLHLNNHLSRGGLAILSTHHPLNHPKALRLRLSAC